MIMTILALLAVQTDKPATPDPAPPTERDVYSQCFMRELSTLEGRDIATSRDGFSRENGVSAIQRCRPARDQLAREIEAQLAADPAYAEPRLRAVELENRVMTAELPLLLLVRAMGR